MSERSRCAVSRSAQEWLPVRQKLTVIAVCCALTTSAVATAAPTESSWVSSRSLLDHFGIEVARQLVHGENLDADEVIRGIDRAVSVGTEDGVGLLVKLLGDPHGLARQNTRVLLSATRALAPFAAQRAVARVLSEAVLSAPRAPPGRSEDASPLEPDPDRRARLELARETAALALARTRDPHATELVLVAARGAGVAQSAARQALLAFLPVATTTPMVLTPNAIAFSGMLGDLRGADVILEALRSLEPPVRIAALRGVATLGDSRGLALAETAATDPVAAVREAATTALVELGASDRAAAVRSLIEDDATAPRGIELSARVASEEIALALAARVRASSDASVRVAAVAALGLQQSPRALVALRELMTDPLLEGDAAEAIARASQPAAWPLIEQALRDPHTRRIGARMAALRGRVLGQIPEEVRASVHTLARAPDGADRAAGVAARILMGDGGLREALADPDVRVRRAAAMASEPTDPASARLLIAQLGRETDRTTRVVLSRGLACGAEAGSVTTTDLRARVRAGNADAAVSVLALARQGEDAERNDILDALGSADPIVRAHAARGLGSSGATWATERLADAYESETDLGVRRAIVLALAARNVDEAVPSRARALDRAARLDPDAAIRSLADRALRSLPTTDGVPRADAVWARVIAGPGPTRSPVVGSLLRADGLAIPIVFDDDGYALSPSPRGPARLILAPRLPAYEPEPHGD